MHDPLAVRSIQGVSRFDAETQQSLQLDGTAVNHVLQRLAIEALHDNEKMPVVLANLVDSANVGMVEGRGRACLSPETF